MYRNIPKKSLVLIRMKKLVKVEIKNDFSSNMLLSKYKEEVQFEAGCDEAGRGCLAGPVFAAAVILPANFSNFQINDSKKLSEKMRFELRPEIQAKSLAWAVAMVENEQIDKINILNASIMAMQKAIQQLSIKPEFIIVDGNRFSRFENIPYQCIVEGDAKYYSIAAASILAKTYRDEYMQKIHHEFPYFQWMQNKGYPTMAHRKAIENYGICKYHRRSFKLMFDQRKIEF